jgi:hypothetical protein
MYAARPEFGRSVVRQTMGVRLAMARIARLIVRSSRDDNDAVRSLCGALQQLGERPPFSPRERAIDFT